MLSLSRCGPGRHAVSEGLSPLRPGSEYDEPLAQGIPTPNPASPPGDPTSL